MSASLVIASCTKPTGPDTPSVEIQYVEKNIPTPPRPRPVDLADVRWYVVTSDNLDEFLETISQQRGRVVFAAITIPDYEALSINLADVRRYLQQQQEIIIYYENATR